MTTDTTTVVELPAIGAPSTLRVRREPLPTPTDGQSVVRVEATGVSFAEQQMRVGRYFDQPSFPFVPGYDLVGTAETGPFAGRRVAAITMVGAWAERVVLDTDQLTPVPEALDPVDAEAAVVNGVTARRLIRQGRVGEGDVVVVYGASGGVGTMVTQLAHLAGATVIGSGSHRQLDAIRAQGADAIDYRGDVPGQVAALAPDGVDVVFDHVGGPGIVDSWRMLRRGGRLVSYGTLATKDHQGDPRRPVYALAARLLWWNLLPNGRRASFFNLWAGQWRQASYRKRVREDLSGVFDLLADGNLTAEVAATLPLEHAAEAMALAEAGGLTGKVVLRPGAEPADTSDAAADPTGGGSS